MFHSEFRNEMIESEYQETRGNRCMTEHMQDKILMPLHFLLTSAYMFIFWDNDNLLYRKEKVHTDLLKHMKVHMKHKSQKSDVAV